MVMTSTTTTKQQLFSELPEYAELKKHYEATAKTLSIKDEFAKDPKRADQFSVRVDIGRGDFLHYDYSKNLITSETIKILTALAKSAGVEEWRKRMFSGEHINVTEDRAVLHVALRARQLPEVQAELAKMKQLSEQVRSGQWKGHSGKPITDVINIGIGGSDLGPAMAVQALGCNSSVRVHFCSNVDGMHLHNTLKNCTPDTTLFIIVSKTFTTRETMLNAQAAKHWLSQSGITDFQKHFIAVSTNQKAVEEFGAKECVKFWDWVGGRYSLWSAVGLSIMMAVGAEEFEELLEGARMMDEHFSMAALDQNMPVIAALLGIWYRNFYNAPTLAVIPYEQALSRLPAYLQQLDMESNGKRASKSGTLIQNYSTGPIVWGEPGTNGQHAFFQHLHQGSDLIPLDLLIGLHPQDAKSDSLNSHLVLYANCLAQSEALMLGEPNTNDAHRHFAGNRPSSTVVYNKLTARTLGAVLAFYEHKVFVQGVIWGINSFDQFGVELGKKLATAIEKELAKQDSNNRDSVAKHDSSTSKLIQLYMQAK